MALLAALATATLLPGFTTTSIGPHGGQVLAGRFPGELRLGDIYLPPGFAPTQRYRTVYLLHGMPGDPSEYLDGTDLETWADDEISAGALPPFIAVLPAAGQTSKYNGEWGGEWETGLVDSVVPWVDATLPTIAEPWARTIAGVSAGGFGAVDIGLHHPNLFGTLESWSGYFTPLHDGPFKRATQSTLAANDPTLLVRSDAASIRRAGLRFFISSGPFHSHWFTPAESVAFAAELRAHKLPVELRLYAHRLGEWSDQLDTGLTWALSRQ